MNLIPAIFRRNSPPDIEALLRESQATVEDRYLETVEFLRERLVDLELALEDSGWQKSFGEGNTEFTRDALTKICALSRLAYLKNPLINRAVSLQTS